MKEKDREVFDSEVNRKTKNKTKKTQTKNCVNTAAKRKKNPRQKKV